MILIDKFYLIVNLSLSHAIVRFSRATLHISVRFSKVKKHIFVRLFSFFQELIWLHILTIKINDSVFQVKNNHSVMK